MANPSLRSAMASYLTNREESPAQPGLQVPEDRVRPGQEMDRLATVTALARTVVDVEIAKCPVRTPCIGEDGALSGLDGSVDERREGIRRRAGNHRQTDRAGCASAPFDGDRDAGFAHATSERLILFCLSIRPRNPVGGPLEGSGRAG